MLRVCGARARTNNHRPCQQPAMDNGRCRLHGGLTPKHNHGPKTTAGKHRQKMGSWKHGLRSKEAREEAKSFRMFLEQSKKELQKLRH